MPSTASMAHLATVCCEPPGPSSRTLCGAPISGRAGREVPRCEVCKAVARAGGVCPRCNARLRGFEP